jgi:hypothetical protein
MDGREIALILKEVDVQMEKIKKAELVVVSKHKICYAGNPKWGIYSPESSSYSYSSSERAELDRTMLGLQKNLGKLRKALY